MMLTNDHADVLARSPTNYLRLALTIDVGLSQDRLAQDSDFPAALRRLVNRKESLMPMLFGQLQNAQMPQTPPTKQIALPRPLSPATYAKSFSRWMEDDPSVGFALEMGIDIGMRSSTVDEVTARAQNADSESSEDTSPVSVDSQTCDTVAMPGGTEDLMQSLQSAVDWANSDQSLHSAQEMGLFSNGLGYSNGYL